jgi:hypothetical protein
MVVRDGRARESAHSLAVIVIGIPVSPSGSSATCADCPKDVHQGFCAAAALVEGEGIVTIRIIHE